MDIVVASMQVETWCRPWHCKLVEQVGDKQDWVLILPGELVEVPKVDTEVKGTILFLANRTGAPAGDWDDRMNPFPSMSSGTHEVDQALCQRRG